MTGMVAMHSEFKQMPDSIGEEDLKEKSAQLLHCQR
jgi:hypothetical protein